MSGTPRNDRKLFGHHHWIWQTKLKIKCFDLWPKKIGKDSDKNGTHKTLSHPLSPFTASSFSWTRPFSICIKISQSVLQPHLQHQFISFSLSFVTTPTRRRQTGGRNFDGGGGQQTTANIFTSVFVRHFIRVLFVLFEGFEAIEPKKSANINKWRRDEFH